LDERGIRKDNDTSLPYTRIVEVREDEKSGTLTSVPKDNYVVEPTRIRKLTPIECERLQGLPDNYTDGIAMTNRYKCLGNAFNVDVVAHILSHIPKA
jgi:DNA (cytosine-5)-methyltransferase 3A